MREPLKKQPNGCIVSYYVTQSGRVPVRDFIELLLPKTRRKFFFVWALLREQGIHLREPHVKYLDAGIYEMRFGGREGSVRVLYFYAQSDELVLVHGFMKKTGKTPKHEIGLAFQRRDDFLKR